MASVTTWARLEPHARSGQMDDALEARIHDACWLLARQWQFGEFRGEDGGSPAAARFRMEPVPITRYRLGRDRQARPYDGAEPLETIVEREPAIEAGRGLRVAVRAGLEWLRLLRAAGVQARTTQSYIDELSIDSTSRPEGLVDSAGEAFRLVTRRVPDGVRLYEALQKWRRRPSRGRPTLPGLTIPGTAAERTKVAPLAPRWTRWYEGLFSVPRRDETAWEPERMEYTFSVSARAQDGEVVLQAAEHHGGPLDWPAFALASTSIDPRRAARTVPTVHAALPAPATFRGMPAARWWEFEDGQVDFGSAPAEPDDLARLVLVEFALVYGNDWFVIPVEAPVGTVCLPRSLVVTDTFGFRTLVRHYTQVDGDAAPWRMFALAGAGETTSHRDALLLPPTLADSSHGVPLEEVLLVRDEMANLAWGIERTVEGVANQAVHRHEATYRSDTPAPIADDGGGAGRALRYRLRSAVPPHWIPLVPERIGDASIQFRRAAMLLPDGSRALPAPLGKALNAGRLPLTIFEEEIPRTGARVTRAFQYARWIDGSSHLWVGRRKRSGRGEGSSGLRFDVATASDRDR